MMKSAAWMVGAGLLLSSASSVARADCRLCDLDVVAVREYREPVHVGKLVQERLRGAVLHIAPEPGLTVAWLYHVLLNEDARMVASGDCPLELADKVRIRERGPVIEVRLVAADADRAHEVVARAKRLVIP